MVNSFSICLVVILLFPESAGAGVFIHLIFFVPSFESRIKRTKIC